MIRNKKFELSKRDMNFFSEFSASAGQAGSYISLSLLILLAFIVVGGGIYAVVFFQTSAINSNIAALNTKMQSESYQADLAKYSDINNSMAGLNQQYYAVSSLLAKVANTDKVETTNMDTLYSNIPKDITITSYVYKQGKITLTGTAKSYYTPLDMIANFSKAKLFSYVQITDISQLELSSAGLTAEELNLENKYSFTIEGSLKTKYEVLISRFVDNTVSQPLTAVGSQTLDVGEQYTESGVNTFTSQDGSIYTLIRISLNNTIVSDQDFAKIQQSDSISGIVSSSVDIKLFYTLTSANGGAQG